MASQLQYQASKRAIPCVLLNGTYISFVFLMRRRELFSSLIKHLRPRFRARLALASLLSIVPEGYITYLTAILNCSPYQAS